MVGIFVLFCSEFQQPGAPSRAKEHMTQGEDIQDTGQPPCAGEPAVQGEGNPERGRASHSKKTCESRLVSLEPEGSLDLIVLWVSLSRGLI